MAEDLASWLESIGLGKYAWVFSQNRIDLDVLPRLTENDLKDLGLPVGDRRRLQAATELLPTNKPLAKSNELPAEKPKAQPNDAERRQVTVLFCDLVGSTALAARHDPEDVRAILRAYQNVSAGSIARYDGYLAKFMGDGVYAYFGYPQAHEDDAERAINAGLALIEAVGALKYDLAVRIGIATGTVVVGDLLGEGASEEAAITGEAPNIAARLQGIAEPNTVVIDRATHRLAGGFFKISALGEAAAKGYAEPLSAFLVKELHKSETRFEAAHSGGLTALIGREDELEILVRRWQRAKSGEGQAVLVSGEPGIGKSRLVQELQARIADEPYVRLHQQCSPYHTSTALYPIVERLTWAARFESEDDADAKLSKLTMMLAKSGQPVDQTLPIFAALLSVPTGDRYPALQLPPAVRKQMTLSALVGQVAGIASKEPTLLVFEDVHWIDPTTLEFLQLLVEKISEIPVLVLITHRPEFRAPWADRPRVTSTLLNRLEPEHSTRMVASVQGAAKLDEELRSRIVAQADGVPLFVEELTRSVVEIAANSPGRAGAIDVPATLKDSLEARLDRMGPAKEIAQIGAVVGRSFDHIMLSKVTGIAERELTVLLDQLLSSGLVQSRGEPPECTYTFKHALIQDTAYGTLLRTRRAELHRRIGETIESAFLEVAEREPELLARHFAEANHPEKSAEYWLKAGRASLQKSSFQEAVTQLKNGLRQAEHLPNGPVRYQLEVGMRTGLAPAIRATTGMGHPDAEKAYQEAYQLCSQDAELPHTFQLQWGLWHIRWSQGNFRPAMRDAENLLISAQASQRTDQMMIAHCSIAFGSWFVGENERAREHFEKSFALYDPQAHAALAHSYVYEFGSFGRIILGLTYFCLGLPDTAIRVADEGVRLARSLNQPHSVMFALTVRFMIFCFTTRCHSSGEERGRVPG